MTKLCAVIAVICVAVGQGTALSAPETKWPSLDEGRVLQIVHAFAAKGVVVCPAQVRTTRDITGSRVHQALDLFARARRTACPRHRSAQDPAYNPDEERATYESEAVLDIAFYKSQKAFDRGVKTWERQLLQWPIVGWSWKPVVLGLNAGYPDVVEAVLKAMKALPDKPRVLFDNS
jgi:hypothetical protein